MAVDAWPAGGVDARRSVADQFGALFDAHYPSLCRLAYLLLGDAARAEDAVQEAFLRTFAGWGRLRQPELAYAYLRKAVLNQCRSGLRRRVTEWRVNSAVGAAESSGIGDGIGDHGALRLDVVSAVRALPPRQREAVVLRYFLDLGEQDIASALGVNVGTVKSQLSKARRNLAAKGGLEGGGGDG